VIKIIITPDCGPISLCTKSSQCVWDHEYHPYHEGHLPPHYPVPCHIGGVAIGPNSVHVFGVYQEDEYDTTPALSGWGRKGLRYFYP
jgi:hypothetical protein